jgi:16S rRNA (cytidine1402-2'-O)-methyltransferase
MSKLYIVGTPIGNLKDITLRAIETLKSVDVIACEDTRVTRKLLSHYQIKNKKLISYNDKNEKKSSKGIIKLLEKNLSVAIVSDAGMPIISDPGFEILRETLKNKINYEVIPGVSAVTQSIVLSNMDTHYKFLGFLKPKTIQRQKQLKNLEFGTYITFISPYKLEKVLLDFKLVFKDEINIFLGRELTKKFETHYRGKPSEILLQIKDSIKGEFTMVFEIKKKKKKNKYGQ